VKFLPARYMFWMRPTSNPVFLDPELECFVGKEGQVSWGGDQQPVARTHKESPARSLWHHGCSIFVPRGRENVRSSAVILPI